MAAWSLSAAGAFAPAAPAPGLRCTLLATAVPALEGASASVRVLFPGVLEAPLHDELCALDVHRYAAAEALAKAARSPYTRGMYVGMRYRSWSVSSKIERFQCKKCGFTSNVQIVGEGEGEGASPCFLDDDGAEQRAHDKAQRSAQEDLVRMQRLITCYQCGYRDPSAFRLERAKSAAILLGGAAMFGVATLVNKSWYFLVIGAAVTWLCWAWWRRQQSRPDDHVIFLDDKNCALPRRSLR